MVGRRDASEYKVVTAIISWDSRKKEGRLNPMAGECFPTYMYIECSKSIRALPVGTKLKLKVVEKNPRNKGDAPHLYTSYRWGYEIVN